MCRVGIIGRGEHPASLEDKKIKKQAKGEAENVRRGSGKTRELKSGGIYSKIWNGGCYER